MTNDDQQIKAIIAKLEMMANDGDSLAYDLVTRLKKSQGYPRHQIVQIAAFMQSSKAIRTMLFGYTVWRKPPSFDAIIEEKRTKAIPAD